MKIALISCLKQDDYLKSWDEVPAEKLFVSDFVKLAKSYSENIYGADKIYFLSTKYALLKPQQIVSLYDNEFGNEDVQRERCRRIISQLILDGCDWEHDEFLILADNHYAPYIMETKMIQDIKMPLLEMDATDTINYLAKALNDKGLLSQSDISKLNFHNLIKATNDILNESR